jgi:[acyl-carrier-protein] S-malonyltransferase
MPKRLALVFPGQGAQYVGMGLDLYERYPQVQDTFDEADSVLGIPLSRLCFEGPEQELNDTINTQPAILTMSVAALRAMAHARELGEVLVVAGHSLGEYSALVAAGTLSFSDAVELVRERGRLMKEAARRHPGGMAAILGLSTEAVTEACREAQEDTGTIVQVANHNSPGQTVISGELTGLERAVQLLKREGARRVVPLAISTAAHCPLMDSAAKGLREALDRIEFREARIPIIANVTGRPLIRAEEIREELVRQLVSPVQWVESVRYMIEQGTKTFVEVGPKDTLTKLIKRISDGVDRTSVGDASGVEAWSDGAIGAHRSMTESQGG